MRPNLSKALLLLAPLCLLGCTSPQPSPYYEDEGYGMPQPVALPSGDGVTYAPAEPIAGPSGRNSGRGLVHSTSVGAHLNTRSGHVTPTLGTSFGRVRLSAHDSGGAVGTYFGPINLSAGF